jgi:hypothetical protein
MRFTREAYFLLPEAISRLLSECLTRTPVILLSLGFGMQSVEFSDILRRAAERTDIEVLAIDLDDRVAARFPSAIPEYKRVFCRPPKGGLGSLLDDIWQDVEKRFIDRGLVRGIDRHRLLSLLFKDRPVAAQSENERGDDLVNYLKDRTLIELALAVAKAKGFVNVGLLDGSRAGRYLRHYIDSTNARRETIYAFCNNIGLRKVGYSRDAMRLVTGAGDPSQPTELIIGPNEWQVARQKLCERVVDALSPGRQRIARTPEGKAALDDVLQKMYSGQEVEVYSPRDSPYDLLFENPQELRTLVGAQVYTIHTLREDWDCLLCVAESGQWLLEPTVRASVREKKGRRIAVIVADAAYKEDLVKKYGEDGARGLPVELPWWLHNQHMTIAVQDRAPVRAVYFERRLRSLAINPVGLETRGDLEVILDSYLAYWMKAKHYSRRADGFVTVDDVRQARDELLFGGSAWDV